MTDVGEPGRADSSTTYRVVFHFAAHYRGPRIARNPKSGEKVQVPEKYVPHFKAGKDLRERVAEYSVGGQTERPADLTARLGKVRQGWGKAICGSPGT